MGERIKFFFWKSLKISLMRIHGKARCLHTTGLVRHRPQVSPCS